MPKIKWIPSYKVMPNTVGLSPIFCFFAFFYLGGFSALFLSEKLEWRGIYIVFYVFIVLLLFCLVFTRCIKSTKRKKRYFESCYDEVEYRKSGWIRIVSKDGKYGLFNLNSNKEILSASYDAIIREKLFSRKHLYRLYEKGRWGLYNYDIKKVIVPCLYDKIEIDEFSSNIMAYMDDHCHLYAANGARKV